MELRQTFTEYFGLTQLSYPHSLHSKLVVGICKQMVHIVMHIQYLQTKYKTLELALTYIGLPDVPFFRGSSSF